MGTGEQHKKFLTAPSAQNILRPGVLSDYIHKANDNVIPDIVTAGVINELKVVNIHQNQRRFETLILYKKLLGLPLKTVAVVNAGQGVAAGETLVAVFFLSEILMLRSQRLQAAPCSARRAAKTVHALGDHQQRPQQPRNDNAQVPVLGGNPGADKFEFFNNYLMITRRQRTPIKIGSASCREAAHSSEV